VKIGNNVDINRHFQILTHDWGSYVLRGKYHDFVNSAGRVSIGNNIYFGTNVIILKGVTIGDNCIIGAGSIVNKDIPSDTVATGVPCKPICTLEAYRNKHKDDFMYIVSKPFEEKKKILLDKFGKK
jgi:acetyltransferase-like isoleucine patch superfamily enzyme